MTGLQRARPPPKVMKVLHVDKRRMQSCRHHCLAVDLGQGLRTRPVGPGQHLDRLKCTRVILYLSRQYLGVITVCSSFRGELMLWMREAAVLGACMYTIVWRQVRQCSGWGRICCVQTQCSACCSSV